MSTRKARRHQPTPDEVLALWYSYFDEGGTIAAPPFLTPEKLQEIARGFRKLERLELKSRRQ